jgi:hypothetical protein
MLLLLLLLLLLRLKLLLLLLLLLLKLLRHTAHCLCRQPLQHEIYQSPPRRFVPILHPTAMTAPSPRTSAILPLLLLVVTPALLESHVPCGGDSVEE